ncbi:Methyltransferase type 11 [Cynara cardunculus var. scolymus]|uniref:Methyltransferase type 11 n=1 Tax=Cynara cardunculus var. scolymus TaxID=59895 RepID=A0A124SDI1_CYNCS|nr:Methyltransferase type 11 [Cynara cardunculus var. scolymus]
MAQRMVNTVHDWSTVKTVLDVGCGRGILLNAVAMQLKKEDRKNTTLSTLRTAGMEGVQEYVTCREGDARRLPFPDNYFDVVVSAGFVHKDGKEFGQKSAAASAERMRVVGEVVRVLNEGGIGVVWDLGFSVKTRGAPVERKAPTPEKTKATAKDPDEDEDEYDE